MQARTAPTVGCQLATHRIMAETTLRFAATSSIRVTDSRIMAASNIRVFYSKSASVTTTGTFVTITRKNSKKITVAEDKDMITTVNVQ
jgi:hypothetical protein